MNSDPVQSGNALSAHDSECQIIAVVMEGRNEFLSIFTRLLPAADYFSDDNHRQVWRCVLELAAQGEPVSFDTLAAAMRRAKTVPDAEGYLIRLGCSHAIHNHKLAQWHAEQVALAFVRRRATEAHRTISTADATPQQLAYELRSTADAIEKIAVETGDTFPEPRKIGDALSPVMQFDPTWLPRSLARWITDIAERMQCPPDFPAVAAMVALSSVAGRRFCIQPKQHDEGWIEFPNLWGMLIGPPSTMKSPSMQAVLRPLRHLEKKAFQDHENTERDQMAAAIQAKFERSALESKAKKALKNGQSFDFAMLVDNDRQEAPLRRFIVNDASLEALGEVLRDNPTGTLLYQDELAGLFAMLEREGNQALRAFLLAAWSGKEGFTFDRIIRGTRRIEHCTLSVLGSIQPGVIAAHVRAANRGTEGADGLMQRFALMVWPDVPPEWREIDRALDHSAEEEAASVFETFEGLTSEDFLRNGAMMGRDGVPVFRFAPDAQERFRQWHCQLEQRLRSEGFPSAFEAHLAKYRKLVPALGVLIHVAEWGTGPVTLSALERAIRWAVYLQTHAARIFGAGNAAVADAARHLLNKIMDGTAGLPADFTVREVHRKGWSGLPATEDVEAACDLLVDHGWLIATLQPPGERGGRPTVRYRLNPRAKSKTSS